MPTSPLFTELAPTGPESWATSKWSYHFFKFIWIDDAPLPKPLKEIIISYMDGFSIPRIVIREALNKFVSHKLRNRKCGRHELLDWEGPRGIYNNYAFEFEKSRVFDKDTMLRLGSAAEFFAHLMEQYLTEYNEIQGIIARHGESLNKMMSLGEFVGHHLLTVDEFIGKIQDTIHNLVVGDALILDDFQDSGTYLLLNVEGELKIEGGAGDYQFPEAAWSIIKKNPGYYDEQIDMHYITVGDSNYVASSAMCGNGEYEEVDGKEWELAD